MTDVTRAEQIAFCEEKASAARLSAAVGEQMWGKELGASEFQREAEMFKAIAETLQPPGEAPTQWLVDALNGLIGLIQLLPDEQRRPLIVNHRYLDALTASNRIESAEPWRRPDPAPWNAEFRETVTQAMRLAEDAGCFDLLERLKPLAALPVPVPPEGS